MRCASRQAEPVFERPAGGVVRCRGLLALAVLILSVSSPPLAAQAAAPSPRHRSTLRVVVYAVGGSLLGAWSGYTTSQVVHSDWEDRAGRSAYRTRLSLAGAGIGLVAGVLIGRRHGVPRASPPGVTRPAPPPVTLPITAEEIRGSAARTVTELLRERRPQWLRSRGTSVLRPNVDPTKAHGVRVYVNGDLLGGLDALDDVSIDAVTGVEFLEAGAAILRWGAGNEDGAILLTTSAAP